MNEFLANNKIFDPQMLNFYSYSGDNPISYVDPDGERYLKLILLIYNTIFGDIPSAGDPADSEQSGTITDSSDGKVSNNIDNIVTDTIKGRMSTPIKIIWSGTQWIFETITGGDEKTVEYHEGSQNYMYTVQSGDTMYELFGDNYQSVADYNGIEDPNNINVGQEIQIPVELE